MFWCITTNSGIFSTLRWSKHLEFHILFSPMMKYHIGNRDARALYWKFLIALCFPSFLNEGKLYRQKLIKLAFFFFSPSLSHGWCGYLWSFFSVTVREERPGESCLCQPINNYMYIRTHAHECTCAQSCICVFYAYFTDQSNAFLRIMYKSDLVQWEKTNPNHAWCFQVWIWDLTKERHD